MARFFLLVNWTDEGVRNVKDTTKRAAAAKQAFEKAGAKLTDVSWTVGPYDLILQAESPDVESITAAALAIGKLGNARTLTLRAFGEAEMQKILQKI